MRRPKSAAPRKRKQPVGNGLRGFAEARKPRVDLLREIQTHVVAQGTKNAGVGREAHKIHVSELIKDTMCPRHLYFKLDHAVATDPPAAAYHRLEMIWATGHDAHHKWQRWLREMGDLWGTWRCLVCTHEWIDVSPDVCPSCGKGLLSYQEVELEDEHYSIVGHADGAVPRLKALIEVKSFAVGTIRIENPELVKRHTHKVDGKTITDVEGIWGDIKRPFKSHLRQGMFYLWMCKQSGDPDLEMYESIVFIYENKTTQATKTFEVKFSQRFIQEFIDVLDQVQTHIGDGIPPARPALYTKDAKPCNQCVFRTGCWQEESSDNDSTASPEVPTRRSRARSEADGGETAVHAARPSRDGDSGRARRHHGDVRQRPDRDDDAADQVGRASRRATGDGGGGRAVGGRSEGQGTRSRFSRKRP